LRAIEEKSHAKCFGSLSNHQPHLAVNMIQVFKPINLDLVAGGVLLQSRNSLLN
jgi:hypothetical protein